ncbi:flagellar hook-basal body protein [Brevibacillus reuszeri]|uniref:flagellar hook-basal body protein n=1 Tax=Brevibacillus reuszeri TaxID=54915 RepID=UPI00289D9917|nr:flagellar hook-basal body protein [Brevibacillus reuszeri]
MIRGLYTSASGMLALQNKHESLANNLANINTPGFKQDLALMRSFPEQLISRVRDNTGPDIPGIPNMGGQAAMIGRLNTGVYMSEALPVFSQGDIEETHNPYDVALMDNIQPDEVGNERRLFYSVAPIDDLTQPADDGNIRFTRNGNWSVNAEGYLVTAEGYYVLDNANMAIQVNKNPDDSTAAANENAGKNLRIDDKGKLWIEYLENTPGQPTATRLEELNATLGLNVIADPSRKLVREGSDRYRLDGQFDVANDVEKIETALQADIDALANNVYNDPKVRGRYGVQQGWQERSNVDPAQTITSMMSVLRAYEANQKVITTIDGTLEKAANELGRVNG